MVSFNLHSSEARAPLAASTFAVSRTATHEIAQAAAAAARARGREPRLDLFRGLAMLIIFVAHVPWNQWSDWIPARWGPSDATEMFVFCSGFAAAIAFGGTFLRAGFWMGTARILFRCWQLYWAHLCLFFTILFVTLVADRYWFGIGTDYVSELNLNVVLGDPRRAIIGLFTFTWVPNYFDILPMYFGILLLTPIVMALQRVDVRLAGAFVIGLYLVNRIVGLHLPAEPWSDRTWFFNPFAWQLLFFTGFFFGRGWLKPPPVNRRLLLLAGFWVLLLVPISQYRIYLAVPWIDTVREYLLPAISKTDFYLIRYVHFLALAYLSLAALRRWPQIIEGPWASPVIRVGQQALPTFLTSMVLAWIGGIVLDQIGRVASTLALVNLVGLGTLIGVAYLVGWLKRAPWQHKGRHALMPTAGQ